MRQLATVGKFSHVDMPSATDSVPSIKPWK